MLGFIVVAIEAGNVYAYRAGWSVNTLPVVQSACVAVLLLVLGFLLYHEAITPSKLIGLACCVVGLYFLNKGVVPRPRAWYDEENAERKRNVEL